MPFLDDDKEMWPHYLIYSIDGASFHIAWSDIDEDNSFAKSTIRHFLSVYNLDEKECTFTFAPCFHQHLGKYFHVYAKRKTFRDRLREAVLCSEP